MLSLRRSWILISLILFISIIPRLWQLESIPPLIIDEHANLQHISDLIQQHKWGIFDFHWDFSKTYLSYFPAIFLVKNFPASNHLLLLRLISVFYSLLALIPLFFIIKTKTSNSVAFSGTLLFSFSYYYLQFSRVGWSDVIFVVTVGLYLVWLMDIALKNNESPSSLRSGYLLPSLRRERNPSEAKFSSLSSTISQSWYFAKGDKKILIIASGFLAGFLFYGYRSGIIYIFAAFLYLSIHLLSVRSKRSEKLSILLAFLIPFLLVILPWIKKISENKEKYNLRANVVSLKNVQPPYHERFTKQEILIYQISTSLKSWILLDPVNGGGHENPRYLPLSAPPFNIFIRVTFWAGLVFLMIKFKKYKYFLIWLFIILATVSGQILTVDPPNGSRALAMLPSYFVISSICLQEISIKFKNRQLFSVGLIILSMLFALDDFIFYQYWMTWIKV